MPYTVSQVRASDPESLLNASRDAETAAARVDAQISKAKSQFVTLATDWTGTAADAAQKQGREMFEDQAEYRDKLRALTTPLSSGGRKLADIRSSLDKAVDSAEEWWDVADDGAVKPGRMLAWFASRSQVNALIVESRRIPIECDIKLKLAQFEAADRDTAYKLRKIGWDLS